MESLVRCFVQFIHPGAEHGISQGVKPWNTGEHRRKFLQVQGSYLDGNDSPLQTAKLSLWGEWEPESEGEPIDRPLRNGPHWVHRPYYVRPASYTGNLQNTDPFIFGDQFLYTLCRQTKSINGHKRPTVFRDLAPGSLILFGSLKSGDFVLDTLFVVSEGVLHDSSSWPNVLAGIVSESYVDVTLRPTYQTERPHPLRLYKGATFADPFQGMFSFVPCMPVASGPKGFPRPAIRLPDVITSSLPIGAKVTRNLSVESVKKMWSRVEKQVLEQGLALGIRFELPPRRAK
jgi:hypothetical protein